MLDRYFEETDADVDRAMDGIAIGIDLGTTNSVVARVDAGRADILVDEQGANLQPSVVAFLPNGERAMGLKAKLRRIIDPENTVFSAKRIIGQPFSLPGIQEAIGRLPYKIVPGDNQECLIETRAGRFSIPAISSLVVEHLRGVAERATGKKVSHCVITVPANFSDAQREATRQAAESAGMVVLRVLNEPTAAALAYGRQREINQRLAVFDMGGGTFDLSLLAVRQGLYEVLGTGGDPFLGGDDMDHALAEELARRFLATHGVDPRVDPQARAKLMIGAEHVKMQLSKQQSADVVISDLVRGIGGVSLPLETHVTRAQLHELIDPIVERSLSCAEGVLADANIIGQNIDEVIMVGGSTRVPRVRERVAEFFGREPKGEIDPLHVVALGAAYHAQTLLDPDSLADGGKDPALLVDVTSHAVGIATVRGYSEVLIAKNTPLPAETTRVFTTATDNQQRVTIKVCQGAEPRFADNTALGELTLENLEPGRRGECKIEVEFLIDADGVLRVSARDSRTMREQQAILSLLGLAGDPSAS